MPFVAARSARRRPTPARTRRPGAAGRRRGIARRPLVARFQTICLICPSSASYHELGSAGTSTTIACPSSTSALLRSSSAVSLSARRTSKRAICEALRPRVGEKRSDRRVQPLRLAQHDVHQLLLLGAERQLLRAGSGSSRTSTPAGCGSRARCRPPSRRPRRAAAASRASRSSFLIVGHVLEREQKPGAAARRLEVRRGQADLELAAPSGRLVAELDAAGAGCRAQIASNRLDARRPAAAARRRSARPIDGAARHAGDRLGARG